MRREYYIHKRKNGIYYVGFIDKASGKKLSTRSTGETDKVKAELWKIQGIPTGRLGRPRPIEEAAGIEAAIRAIRKAKLNPDDALRIVRTLFIVDWRDKRAFVASLVAATTGARQGECLALRRSDVGADTLNIAHSFMEYFPKMPGYLSITAVYACISVSIRSNSKFQINSLD